MPLMMPFELQALGAITLAALGAITDVQTRRIPNRLTVPAALLAVAVAAAVDAHWLAPTHPVGLLQALASGLGVLVLVVAFFSAGLLGGGDGKLLAALGLWVGFPAVLYVVLYAVAGALAMVVLLSLQRRKSVALLRSMVALPASLLVPGLRQHVDEELAGLKLPLGVAVFLGTMVWFLQMRLGGLS